MRKQIIYRDHQRSARYFLVQIQKRAIESIGINKVSVELI